MKDPSISGTIRASRRADPPARIGEVKVKAVEDLSEGSETLPPSDVLRYTLKGGSRVIVRPSGTEPKLKAYLDVRGESTTDAAERIAALGEGVRALLDARS